jgi:hypothetical protein
MMVAYRRGALSTRRWILCSRRSPTQPKQGRSLSGTRRRANSRRETATMTERTELVHLLLGVAREREVNGQHTAASRLRRVAVAISGASDQTLVASGFARHHCMRPSGGRRKACCLQGRARADDHLDRGTACSKAYRVLTIVVTSSSNGVKFLMPNLFGPQRRRDGADQQSHR